MASSDSQIDKSQRGRPKRAELLDVNINTGTQSINSETASLRDDNGYQVSYWIPEKNKQTNRQTNSFP